MTQGKDRELKMEDEKVEEIEVRSTPNVESDFAALLISRATLQRMAMGSSPSYKVVPQQNDVLLNPLAQGTARQLPIVTFWSHKDVAPQLTTFVLL